MAWSRDVTNLDSLQAALAVLRQIPMKPMRQGIDIFSVFISIN